MAAFDVELNVSELPHFEIARSTFFSGVRVRVFGHRELVTVYLPPVSGEFVIFNDGTGLVRVCRGSTFSSVKPGKTATFEVDDTESADDTNLIQIG